MLPSLHMDSGKKTAEAEFLDEIQVNLKSFPPCYSQSPLELGLEINIS